MEVVIRYSKAKYVFFVFVCVFMCLQFNGKAKTEEWRRRARQQRWRPATCRRCQPFVLKSIRWVFLIIIVVVIIIIMSSSSSLLSPSSSSTLSSLPTLRSQIHTLCCVFLIIIVVVLIITDFVVPANFSFSNACGSIRCVFVIIVTRPCFVSWISTLSPWSPCLSLPAAMLIARKDHNERKTLMSPNSEWKIRVLEPDNFKERGKGLLCLKKNQWCFYMV